MFNISAANSQTTSLGVICTQRTVPTMCELIGMSYLDVSGLLAVVDFIVHFNLKSVGKTLHRPGIEPGPPAWQASILPLNHRC